MAAIKAALVVLLVAIPASQVVHDLDAVCPQHPVTRVYPTQQQPDDTTMVTWCS